MENYGPPITFWVPGNPVPKERPRLARNGMVFTPKKSLDWEKVVALHARAAGVTRAERPRRFLVQMLFKMRNPWVGDGDNLEKAVLDGLCDKRARRGKNPKPRVLGVAFQDDVQVFDVVRKKKQAQDGKTGVKVIIQEIL